MSSTETRLTLLRSQFKLTQPQISAYIVPTSDSHQSEYTPDNAQRRTYISNFTGSAGTAVVTSSKAALWTDGRYWNQASYELNSNWILMKAGHPDTPTISEWLFQNLDASSSVGIDPKLYDFNQYESLQKALKSKRIKLEPIEYNLVDKIWAGRPDVPKSRVFPHKTEFSGLSWREKVEQVRATMKKEGAGVLLVTMLDEIAWLYNIRASDVAFNPVLLSYAVITKENAYLFLDDFNRLDSDILGHFGISKVNGNQESTERVVLREYDDVFDVLKTEANGLPSEEFCWIPKNSSYFAAMQVQSESLLQTDWSPISRLKAVKNETELNGIRRAHIKDAVALTEYFYWLENELKNDSIVDEVDGSDKLDGLRMQQENSISLSFTTISSTGPNGAIIHYSAKKDTCARIDKNQIYLCDSGGQYLEGTTDITRTMHFSTPSNYEKEMFTRVLRGHIALARARFPKNSSGSRLDTFARQYLWSCGKDYQHGTGHGVGCFLNVHEGPICISTRAGPQDMGLVPGMILSNEPGYYEDGCMGIRIENLIQVVESKENPNNFCEFETLSLFPIQKKLINTEMMTKEEVDWLNEYHQNVFAVVSQELDNQKKPSYLVDWLRNETTPL